MGLMAKLLGVLVLDLPYPQLLLPCLLLLTAVRRWPSFSDSFLLMALLVNAAIPRGPVAAPGESVDGQPSCPRPWFPP